MAVPLTARGRRQRPLVVLLLVLVAALVDLLILAPLAVLAGLGVAVFLIVLLSTVRREGVLTVADRPPVPTSGGGRGSALSGLRRESHRAACLGTTHPGREME